MSVFKTELCSCAVRPSPPQRTTLCACFRHRSATKGVRVFRMYRDDPYLATMLSLVSRFHTSHVLQHKPPPVNMFSTDPTYIQFLYRTLQLARRAKEIVCCSDLPLPHGVDDRAFV